MSPSRAVKQAEPLPGVPPFPSLRLGRTLRGGTTGFLHALLLSPLMKGYSYRDDHISYGKPSLHPAFTFLPCLDHLAVCLRWIKALSYLLIMLQNLFIYRLVTRILQQNYAYVAKVSV